MCRWSSGFRNTDGAFEAIEWRKKVQNVNQSNSKPRIANVVFWRHTGGDVKHSMCHVIGYRLYWVVVPVLRRAEVMDSKERKDEKMEGRLCRKKSVIR